ncbi:hypothetical protein F5050DRAFT_1736690 [Lentinula boryana]|uniref:Matrin-type domain-containing protein n=1 Tax=Lentinula boryana TaxID=40481 RepID=A0ABQ8QMK3_9AGAR|nr:hypothetical protein F5050DRAFT_1736690 [Lentinula boryana]
MSEYWVSKKKYYCKYCETYIADDVPSRQHHENGLRHKGNRERFIRGLYKEGEKRKKDSEDEKREMARVELAAQAAYSQDIGAGRTKATSSSASASTSKKPTTKAPPKPSNPFTNYSTAASLGYIDPDVERAVAEAALHQSQGVAGEWQVVETVTAPTSMTPEGDDATLTTSALDDGAHSLKRLADQQPEDVRNFKIRRKILGAGLGEIYDPGEIKLKPRKEVKVEEEVKVKSEPAAPEASLENEQKPKWVAVKWKRATTSDATPASDGAQATSKDTVNEAAGPPLSSDNSATVKLESEDTSSRDNSPVVKTEPTPTDEILPKTESEEAEPSTLSIAEPVPSMFRKRKVASGSGSRVKREI